MLYSLAELVNKRHNGIITMHDAGSGRGRAGAASLSVYQVSTSLARTR